jgi:transposase InsO family protein
MTAAAISPTTGRTYGVERVCTTWEQPRSTFYARRAVARAMTPRLLAKRGPKPKCTDDELLAFIRADLLRTPFIGEGHRKVWARLRVLDKVRVSRKRVLRVMRENHLLSPHRSRQGNERLHDGEIITAAPNVMWGTDGARVETVEDGWVWIFTAVEHWNAEVVGWHVCKEGTRYAALEPISQGIQRYFGSLVAGVARGLLMRADHGPQYISDHFINQLKFWGVAPSWAFISEPQTNGVAERFNRTLKEQAIYGRVFKNVDEVRAAVGAFVARYNAEWLVEKLGFVSPLRARETTDLRNAA